MLSGTNLGPALPFAAIQNSELSPAEINRAEKATKDSGAEDMSARPATAAQMIKESAAAQMRSSLLFLKGNYQNNDYIEDLLDTIEGLNQLLDTIEGLNQLASNLAKNDRKYHEVRTGNATFAKRVWQHSGALDCMQVFGFQYHESRHVVKYSPLHNNPELEMAQIEGSTNELRTQIKILKEEIEQRQQAEVTQRIKSSPVTSQPERQSVATDKEFNIAETITDDVTQGNHCPDHSDDDAELSQEY